VRTRCIVLALATLVPVAGCHQGPGATDLLGRYQQLHEAGDVDGLLALHTRETVFLLPGQDPIRGKEALRGLLEWDATLGARLDFRGIRVEGNTIVVDSIIERTRFFEALGIPEVRYGKGTRFVLEDGLIAETRPANFDDETARRIRQAFDALLPWLSEHHPGDVARLLPGGKFRYDAESARRWLELLAEWRAANDAGPSGQTSRSRNSTS